MNYCRRVINLDANCREECATRTKAFELIIPFKIPSGYDALTYSELVCVVKNTFCCSMGFSFTEGVNKYSLVNEVECLP